MTQQTQAHNGQAAHKAVYALVCAALWTEGAQLERTEDVLALAADESLARVLRNLAATGHYEAVDEADPLVEDGTSVDDYLWWQRRSGQDKLEARRLILLRQVMEFWTKDQRKIPWDEVRSARPGDLESLIGIIIRDNVTLTDLIGHQIASVVRAERTLDGLCALSLAGRRLPFQVATKLMRGEVAPRELARCLNLRHTADLWSVAVDIGKYRRAAWQRRAAQHQEA